MENSIFRKSSLERISSPEQLNDYVKITNPGIWLVLLGLFSLLLAVGVWAYSGTIPETVQLSGVVFSDKAEAETVYFYMPMSVSKRLSEGMTVQVSPDYAPRAEYGYIFGIVQSIGEKPVTEADLVNTFGSIQYVQEIMPKGNVVEGRVTLETVAGKLKWSNPKGESIAVTSGSSCNLLLVTKERRPYELLLN